MKATQPLSVTIRQIEFELEKAEHGMGMPYDAERVGQLRKRVGQLRKMLIEARKRKLSEGLARRLHAASPAQPSDAPCPDRVWPTTPHN